MNLEDEGSVSLLFRCSAFSSLLRALVAYGKNLEDEEIKNHIGHVAGLLGIPEERMKNEVSLVRGDKELTSLAAEECPSVLCKPGDILGRSFQVRDIGYNMELIQLLSKKDSKSVQLASPRLAVSPVVPHPRTPTKGARRILGAENTLRAAKTRKELEKEIIGMKVYTDKEQQKSYEIFLKRMFMAANNTTNSKNVSYYRKFVAQIEKEMLEIHELAEEIF